MATTETRPRGEARKALLRAMFAEWRCIAPNLAFPDAATDDEARHQWTAQQLCVASGAPTSWSRLTVGEMRQLIKIMREESGSASDYRSMLIARLAAELFGPAWERLLGERLRMRFQRTRPSDLSPGEAHAEIEELMSRIARRDGIDIETVRAKFSRRATL